MKGKFIYTDNSGETGKQAHCFLRNLLETVGLVEMWYISEERDTVKHKTGYFRETQY